jgi:hypothetical protein
MAEPRAKDKIAAPCRSVYPVGCGCQREDNDKSDEDFGGGDPTSVELLGCKLCQVSAD